MIIKWTEGEVVHEFEWSGSPRTQEGRWIKERTGWSTKKFLEALEELDPDAIIALIIILSGREGRKIKWDEVDIDPVNDLDWIPTEEEKKKIEEAAAAEAAASGKGSLLPPAPEDTVRKIDNVTGRTPNGHLAVAVLSPKSEPTHSSSGTDSA